MATTLRQGTAADLDGVVAVFLDCWRTSYATVLPARVRDSMTEASARELWRTAFARASDSTVLVAVEGTVEVDTAVASSTPGSPAGAVLGVARWSQQVGSTRGDVHSLYVSPRAQGRGLGTVLLDAAVARLAASGAEVARLWVFESNRASLDFYRSRGFAFDGRRRTEAAYGVSELGLSLPITQRAPATAEVASARTTKAGTAEAGT
ncbi:GNAT family N-acetyltransferase [Herbiconiux flava]|uniref:Ribosomal protein S18 acetylase RimI-like enzyme n=1 Tax=Herbiconiux flava TaxID=881268 RepID=A0A852SK19_9MICO|nr:GNAT family N-acetyltransferase [Herbiconiux flava]NYD69930.1 ribosomal protein S18 acetylase RimI-like enzyme [Herbiconiux flava]GLK16680.1 hypothetical protein GCM10017602_11620 [Herbiconiux flava]